MCSQSVFLISVNFPTRTVCVVRVGLVLMYPIISSLGWINNATREHHRCLNRYLRDYPMKTKKCGKNIIHCSHEKWHFILLFDVESFELMIGLLYYPTMEQNDTKLANKEFEESYYSGDASVVENEMGIIGFMKVKSLPKTYYNHVITLHL